MSTKFLDMFSADARNLGVKTLAYYDSKSKEYLQKYLETYRRNALAKGMVPRTINVVREIVDKSGMLFSGRAPTLNVYPTGATELKVDDNASLQLQHLMEKATWIEFFNNFDSTVRLLKTGMVLVQYDAETQEVFFTNLTQANSAVNVVNRQVETLIYFTGAKGDVDTYRIWTKDIVQDLEVTTGGGERVIPVGDNPYGIIPVAVFHDTNVPRDGFWNHIPEDLLHINDIYNLHITDGEFSIAHAKMQTLYTNATVQGSGVDLGATAIVDYGSKLGPRAVGVPGGDFYAGGPGELVGIETAGGDSVFLEYKGPAPDIAPLDAAIRGWFRDYARGWSVAIEMEGNGYGSADSGFKLVVRELPNLELRRKRQRMFERGFRQLYDVLLKVNQVFNVGLVPNTVLYAEFLPPELPTDEGVTEEIWTQKIKEGRASVLDYFCDQKGYSREEAEVKVKQLAADRVLLESLNLTSTPRPSEVIAPIA